MSGRPTRSRRDFPIDLLVLAVRRRRSDLVRGARARNGRRRRRGRAAAPEARSSSSSRSATRASSISTRRSPRITTSSTLEWRRSTMFASAAPSASPSTPSAVRCGRAGARPPRPASILPPNYPGLQADGRPRTGQRGGPRRARDARPRVRARQAPGSRSGLPAALAERGRYMVSFLGSLGFARARRSFRRDGTFSRRSRSTSPRWPTPARGPRSALRVRQRTSRPPPSSSRRCSAAPGSYRNRPQESVNLAEFCDPSIDAEMAHATALQAQDPPAATLLWQRIERSSSRRRRSCRRPTSATWTSSRSASATISTTRVRRVAEPALGQVSGSSSASTSSSVSRRLISRARPSATSTAAGRGSRL